IGLEPVIISKLVKNTAASVQLGIKQGATAVQEQNANHHPSKNAFHKCPPTRQTSKLAHAQHPDAIAATRRDRSAQVMHRLMHSGSASLALIFGRIFVAGKMAASVRRLQTPFTPQCCALCAATAILLAAPQATSRT